MLITIDNVLTAEELAMVRDGLDRATWDNGAITAGSQAAQVKNNQQVAESCQQLPALRRLVLASLQRSSLFFSAALPLNVLPPFFNRYSGNSNYYGFHVDSAMRPLSQKTYLRSDLSATLFLSAPEEYEGGVLTIQDTFGQHGIKLNAGSMVLYPSSSLHAVTPVTQGTRTACFLFLQSMVRDAQRRRLLYEMDMALLSLRQQECEAVVQLTGIYHNLLRLWAEN